MSERQLPDPQEVIDLLLKTRANAKAMRVAHHGAETQTDEHVYTLMNLLGGVATDHYMRHRAPSEVTIGQVGQSAALAGLHWLTARALGNGIEHQLPTILRETNEWVVAELSGGLVTATLVEEVRPSMVFGIKTSGGTRYGSDIPAVVSGPLIRADTDQAKLYLGHPDNTKYSWEVALLNSRDQLQVDLSFSPLPEAVA